MGPNTNAIPQRTTPHTAGELEQFRETREREASGPAGRELVDSLLGRASLMPAWRDVLGAAVPAVDPIARRIHAARHPESPGGSAITAGEAAQIAGAAARAFEAALLELLGVRIEPATVVAPSSNPERAGSQVGKSAPARTRKPRKS